MTTKKADQTDAEQLIEGFTLGHFATNCYLIAAPDEDRCWFIDASWGAAALTKRAKERDLTPERLILTHAHPDHIAGVHEIKDAHPNLPVAIHSAEKEWLTNPDKNLSTRLGDDPITVGPPDDILEDAQTLTLGTLSWRVLHTQGHSPGGISLYCQQLAVVIAGDTLFAGSIGRFDFPSCDEQALFTSIREKLYALPDDTIVLPGHGPATTIGAEKATNPYVRPLA